MRDDVLCILIILVIEIVGFFIFLLISKWNNNGGERNKIDFRSVLKGVLERIFITFTLLLGLPQALTVFAALKIATRIKDDNKVSNDFYLVGNLLSIIMALVYVKLIEQYFL